MSYNIITTSFPQSSISGSIEDIKNQISQLQQKQRELLVLDVYYYFSQHYLNETLNIECKLDDIDGTVYKLEVRKYILRHQILVLEYVEDATLKIKMSLSGDLFNNFYSSKNTPLVFKNNESERLKLFIYFLENGEQWLKNNNIVLFKEKLENKLEKKSINLSEKNDNKI